MNERPSECGSEAEAQDEAERVLLHNIALSTHHKRQIALHLELIGRALIIVTQPRCARHAFLFVWVGKDPGFLRSGYVYCVE